MSIATLKQLSAQATAGPWEASRETSRITADYLQFAVGITHGVEIGRRNGQLIAAMRNNIDALLECAKTLERMTPMMEVASVRLITDDAIAHASNLVADARAALARLEA